MSEVSRVQEPDQWPCTKPRVRRHPGDRSPLPEVDRCTHEVCRPKGPTVALDDDPSPRRTRPWDADYATAYGSLHEVVRAFLAGERNARYLRRMHAEIESELTGGDRRG